MSRPAQLIEAHERDVSRRYADRRGELIEHWRHWRRGNSAAPASNLAIQFVADGTVNEVQLGFYVLMDICLADARFLPELLGLANHRSVKVRRGLAFYLSEDFPSEFRADVYRELLRDKAASVRVRTVQSIGMRAFGKTLGDLHKLRSAEKNAKVIEALAYWIPLLEKGYRIDTSPHAGRLTVTALTGEGIASTTLETNDSCDPRIPKLVAQLRRQAQKGLTIGLKRTPRSC